MDPTDSLAGLRGAALVALFVNLAALVVAVPWALVVLVARRGARARADLAIVTLLVAVAFALRWWLPTHSAIHENHHGFNVIWGLTSPLEHVSVFGIPWAFHVLIRLANALLPVSDENVFLLNALWSAAAVGGTYVLASAMFRSRLAGWASALALLFLPLAIALAPTEESMVAATGALLVGAAFVWLGARDRLGAPLVAGLLLICLASTMRESALILSATVPLLVLGAVSGPPWRAWGTWAVALGVPFVVLLPQAWLTLRALGDCTVVPCGVMGMPHVELLAWWLEWQTPFVPTWMTVGAWAGLAALVVRAVVRRTWREALVVLGCILLARASSGLVTGGYFPSHLRYSLLVSSLFALPVGWLVARLVEALPTFSGATARAAAVVLPVAGLASLATHLDGASFDLPITREYRFFRDGLAGLEASARFVSFDEPSLKIPPLTQEWVNTVRPGWRAIPAARWLAGGGAPATLPTYLLLDRSCFTEAACPWDPRSCGHPTVTPFGTMNERCARVLASRAWRTVSQASIDLRPFADLPTLYGQGLDLPPFDDPVHVAILRVP